MENVKRISIKTIIDYLIIFCSIYFGRDTLTNTTIGVMPCYVILGIIALYMLVIILHNVKNGNIEKNVFLKRMAFCAFAIILMLASMLINRSFTFMYITVCFAVGYVFLMTFYYDTNFFWKIFKHTICFLIVCSLIITYMLSEVFCFETITNIAGLEFNNWILGYVPIMDNYVRNFGIFREPGVYQIFILAALYYNMFVKSKEEKLRVFENVVLLIGLLSTFSIIGYICFAILLFAYFIENLSLFSKIVNKKGFWAAIIAVIMICIAIIFLNSDVYWMVYSMVGKIKNLGLSNPRVASIIYNISMFIKSPFYGNDIIEILTGVAHNTCSLLVLFSVFGFGPAFLYIYLLRKVIGFKIGDKKEMLKGIVLVGYWFLYLNNQCMITNIYLYAIPVFMYLCKNRNKKEIEIEK